MAGFWSIIIPEPGQNILANPSFELQTGGLVGWTANGGSIARSSAQCRRGAYSGAYTPSAAVNASAVYSGVPLNLVNGTTYTFTVDVLGVNGVAYKVWFSSTGFASLAATQFTGTGQWQRISVTWTENVGAARYVNVGKDNNASVGVIYIDGADLKAKAYQDTYVDGDQPGCSWDGVPHNSTSTRSAYDSNGGREFNLDSYTTYALATPGIGMPGLNNDAVPYGNLDGAFFQTTVTGVRQLTLVVKPIGSSRINLHTLRQSLIDFLKPDRLPTKQPVTLIYAGNTRRSFLRVVYDGGLEFGSNDGFTESIAMRFLAYDPYWQEEGNEGAVLGLTNAFTSRGAGDALLRDATGLWQAMGTGLNGQCFAVAYGPDGAFYVGGSFADAGGVANTAFLAKWANGAWASVTGASALNGNVNALAFGPDGLLYIGGSFTAIGAVANSGYIANVDVLGTYGTAGTITGMNVASLSAAAPVYAIYVPPSGSALALNNVSVYIGGQLSASATANRVAYYAVSSWTTIGSLGSSAAVRCLAGSPNGAILYAGWDNSQQLIDSVANCYGVGKWAQLGSWTPLGPGVIHTGAAAVYAMYVSSDGILYIGGDFSGSVGSAANTQNRLMAWNGYVWNGVGGSLGSGGSAIVRCISADPLGRLWIGGRSLTIQSGQNNYAGWLVVWDGSSFIQPELQSTAASDILYGVAFSPTQIVLVFGGFGGPVAMAAQNILTNHGTAKAYPTLRFIGPGRIYRISNTTSGDDIYLTASLVSGEIATLTLSPTNRSFKSSFLGNIIGTILPGSVLNQFSLLPGVNDVNIVADTTITFSVITWPRRHWSADGAN